MKNQSGNVLFYILIAVALLGALSFAVSESTRGTGDISEDRAKLYAGEIIDYANTLATAVGQLRLRSCAATEINFDNSITSTDYNNGSAPSDDSCDIFSPSGGALTYTAPTSDAMDSTASPDNEWHFYADNEIELIGTTNSAASGADLIIVLDELSEIVCRNINGLLGITDASTTPPNDTDIGETAFTGSFSYTRTIGDEASALSGQSAACIQNTTDSKYAFYKVLIAR